MRPVSSLAQTNLWYGRRGKRFLCVGLLTCAGFAAFAAAPVVSNVRVAQRPGTGALDITYDLADSDSDFLSVTVNISTNDGASWFGPVSTNLSGAVGRYNVSPGNARTIAWQGCRELPAQLFPSVRAKIEADDASLSTYLVIDLSEGTNATHYPLTSLDAVPEGGWTSEYKTTKMVMRRIPAGDFTMGSPSGEVGKQVDEVQHLVSLSSDFYVGVFEVTQKQWERVMGNWPSLFSNVNYRESRPVESVSYNDIRGSIAGARWPEANTVDDVSFMGKLRAKTNRMFDLLSEAQWEYACRAGTGTALNSGYNLQYYAGQDGNAAVVARHYSILGPYDYTIDTSRGSATVGSYRVNQWGLYDMHGNVYEWCLDWYEPYLAASTDPKGPIAGSIRVLRGGSWSEWAGYCRSANRGYQYNKPGVESHGAGNGFRAALTLGQAGISVTNGSTSDLSSAGVYDLSPSYKAVGITAVQVGDIYAIQLVDDNSGDGGTSIRMGGPDFLGDGELAGIEWTVTGTGVLAFDWQVSSETGNDGLRFCEVGSAVTNFISGTGVGWKRVFVTVAGTPETLHTFRWEYAKDANGMSMGLDCGWGDAVSWSPFYALTVDFGTGDGAYTNGAVAGIVADAPRAREMFEKWTGATQFVANVRASSTTVTMPAADIEVTATYVDLYDLTVTDGTGSGVYTNGQRVAIAAAPPPTGRIFDRWTGETQYLDNALSPTTVLQMPVSDVAVVATYIDAYTLTVNAGSGDGLYPEGSLVAIMADAPPRGLSFVQWTGDTQRVANVCAASTTASMPAAATTVTAVFKQLLPESRILDFDDYVLTNNAPTPTWRHEGPMPTGLNNVRALLPGTNHYHRTGWYLLSCRTGCSGYLTNARIIPPKSPAPVYPNFVVSNLAANLRNDLGARIESPVFTNGIGTVYFEAINSLQAYPTQISVDIATNMVSLDLGTIVGTVAPPSTNGLDYVWQPLDVLDLNAATTNDFVRYRKLVNCRDPIKMRMRRTDYNTGVSIDNAFTVIDNIRVSLPPSDVAITRPECLFAPGYPCANAAMTIRCMVSNADTNAPTDSRAVKVCTRWRYLNQRVGAWMTNGMDYVEGTGDGQGNGEVYQAALPPQGEVGDLEYYFICAFSGVSYVSPDFTGGGYQYASESLSPRTLRGTPGEYAVRLRPFASDYGAVCVESDQHAETIGMTLAGDGVWRALVPMGCLGLTNLTWRFKAAAAFDPGTASFATGVTYWAATGQPAMPYTPFDGVCVPDDGSGRLGLKVTPCGYVMITLDTRTLAYQARRAEAQDFNAWPGRTDVFSESSGQASEQSYLNSFNAWPTNFDTVCLEPFSAFVSATNVYSHSSFLTPQMWTAGSAAYVSERTFDTVHAPTGVSNFRNLALRLKAGDGALELGNVRNTLTTLPDGLKRITFKGRLGQKSDIRDIVFKRDDFAKSNYVVQATINANASAISPETPSLSLIAYYRDPGNFYEFRTTQVVNPAGTAANPQDVRANYRLYKWVNGSSTLLAEASANLTASPLTLISDSAQAEMRLYDTSGNATLIRCKFANYDNVLAYTDSTSPFQYGTYGFLSAECRASLSSVSVGATTTNAVLSGSVTTTLGASTTFDTDIASWYYPTNRYTANNALSPKGIYSVVPAQAIGVYAQNAVYGSGQDASSTGWSLIGQVTITNFTYQASTFTFNSWQSQYVKLQVMGGSADVAVDELAVSSWHGSTVPAGALPTDWLATEAWVVSNSADHAQVVQLDHSRANPTIAQAVRSLLLTNGLGLMEFDYRVLRPPARLTVQYARAAAPDAWNDVRSVSVTNVTDWLHGSVYLGFQGPGYFRLVNDRSGGCTNALVEIDNARVWDEPAVGDTSWWVYNAKVTDTDASRVALDSTKACFLNNSPTAEAAPVQDQSDPYVQTPVLSGGLGYLSFSARAYDTGQVATVWLCVSTNGWNAPADKWFEIYRFENITNTLYARYSFEVPTGVDCDAVRLMTRTAGGAKRVCLEDIVVAEPSVVRADIVSVCASRPQQTITQSGSAVDVTVRLAGRFARRKGVPGADAAHGPELGLIVNGEKAYAPLHSLTVTHVAEGWRTDAVFRYKVRPGDMAEPLRLVGTGRARDPYSFQWNGWEIYSQDTSSNAMWRFNLRLMTAGDAFDPDLSGAGVVLKTLAFDTQTPDWVPATEAVVWRVKTDRDVGDAPFQVRVWTPQTNIVQVGSVSNQAALTLDLSSGGAGATCSQAAFSLLGLSQGTADIYVQRVPDYAANATAGIKSFVKRTITVTRTPLKRWNEVAGTLAGGGIYKVNSCETDAGGVSVVCDGGGVGSVFRFIGDRGVAFTNLALTVSNGATVVIEDLNIDNRSVEGLSAVSAADGHPHNTLVLIGQNAAWGGRMASGVCVQAQEGTTNALAVTSGAGTNGMLTSLGGVLAAGIGGCPFAGGGSVSVRGTAVVAALGGEFGAGVGGGVAAAGGTVEVAGQSVLLATGGGGGACDVGPGANCEVPAAVRFTGGLILTGRGVSGVSEFVTDGHRTARVGAFAPVGWYAFSRDGGPDVGRLYVAVPMIGMHSISNVTQAGVYTLSAMDGGAAVTFEIVRTGPVVPAGVRKVASFYVVWLQRHGLESADLSVIEPLAFDTAWLLDQNPQTFASGELKITDVEVSAGVIRGSYMVKAFAAGGPQTVTHLNGRLVVMGADTLAGAFTEVAEITASVDEGTYSFEIPCRTDARFIKIMIVFPE